MAFIRVFLETIHFTLPGVTEIIMHTILPVNLTVAKNNYAILLNDC